MNPELVICRPTYVLEPGVPFALPAAVLLPAFEADSLAPALPRLVASLVARGASCFVCVGPHAERLHDAVDDVLIEQDLVGDEEARTITTTWHDEDALEECVFFFMTAVPMAAREGCCLVALLDEDRPDERAVIQLLARGSGDVRDDQKRRKS